jgi:hypothetical protein
MVRIFTLKFLKNSYNYGFKQNQKSFGQPKSGCQTKKHRKERLHINLLETQSRRKIPNQVCTSKINKDNPFQEVFMHYGVGKFPIVALTNWGEDDPIVEFSKKLRKSSESENWRLAKQLDPKMRVFAPVIVRGEEDKGVRLFEFSKTIYMELLSIADDEDYGDFTDVAEGFDFVVNASKVQDRPGFALSLRPKPKQTPLSSDASQIDNLVRKPTNFIRRKI